MISKKLKDLLLEARDKNYALGHFNFSDSITLRAIIETCQNLRSPAFVGTSEGEAKFIGHAQAVALLDGWRRVADVPIFLNADHHKSFESAKEAIDAGYDSIQIDEMSLSLEENTRITRQVVEYAKGRNLDISIEGGLGYIRTEASKIYRELIEVKPEDMTSVEEATRFVKETGVDRLAIVIGNIHGISLKGNPRLHIERLREIHDVLPHIPLTLHGGSGIDDNEIRASLPLGMSNIHINTELRVALHDMLRYTLTNTPDETTPYKFLLPALEAVSGVVEKKLRLFRAVNIL